MSTDPELDTKAKANDKGIMSLQKINSLFFTRAGPGTDPTLAPTVTDNELTSLQKINALCWEILNTGPEGGGGGIPEAPADGAQYVRQNSVWVAIKPPPQPFAPTLSSITPSSVTAGSPDTIITFTGTGFIDQQMKPCFGDQLMSWYTQMVGPHYINSTQFQATLGANLLANPTSFFLWLQNTGGPDTNNLQFDVT